jgi:nucleoside-diphosphate-sugar epimerase
VRVLVTGATGFVGRWATNALTARGAEVVRLSRTASHGGDCGPMIVANLLDPRAMRRVVNEVRPNVVLHLAWDVSHGQFYQAATNLDWLAASVHLMRAAIDADVSRIVGVGTCVEYSPP